MKKVLKISTVLVLACAMILSLNVKALAAGSKTDAVEITSATKDGEDVKYTLEPVDENDVKPLTEDRASKELAAKSVKTIDASGLKVLWQKDVLDAPAGTKFAFSVTGYDGQTVYAFHWNSETENWDYVNKGTAANFEITFPDLSPIGLVVELPESSENAPKTGDNSNVVLWASVLVVAAAGAVGTMLYSKKRKTEA